MGRFRITSAFVLCFLTLQAGGSHAANWRNVGEVPSTGAVVSVDDDSLTVDHDVVARGMVRFDYKQPRVQDGHKLNAFVAQRMVNCDTNRYWQMDAWGYRENAEPVRLYGTSQEWLMPEPDSENEIASAVLCSETKSIFSIVWARIIAVLRQLK